MFLILGKDLYWFYSLKHILRDRAVIFFSKKLLIGYLKEKNILHILPLLFISEITKTTVCLYVVTCWCFLVRYVFSSFVTMKFQLLWVSSEMLAYLILCLQEPFIFLYCFPTIIKLALQNIVICLCRGLTIISYAKLIYVISISLPLPSLR